MHDMEQAVARTAARGRSIVLHRITVLAIAAPRRVLAVAALLMLIAVVFGVPVAKTLSAGGFQDPSAESARATELLTEKFGQCDVQLMFMVTAPDGVRGAAARAAGADIVNQFNNAPDVVDVVSPWTAPPEAAGLVSSVTAVRVWSSRVSPAARRRRRSGRRRSPTRCRSRCCANTAM